MNDFNFGKSDSFLPIQSLVSEKALSIRADLSKKLSMRLSLNNMEECFCQVGEALLNQLSEVDFLKRKLAESETQALQTSKTLNQSQLDRDKIISDLRANLSDIKKENKDLRMKISKAETGFEQLEVRYKALESEFQSLKFVASKGDRVSYIIKENSSYGASPVERKNTGVMVMENYQKTIGSQKGIIRDFIICFKEITSRAESSLTLRRTYLRDHFQDIREDLEKTRVIDLSSISVRDEQLLPENVHEIRESFSRVFDFFDMFDSSIISTFGDYIRPESSMENEELFVKLKKKMYPPLKTYIDTAKILEHTHDLIAEQSHDLKQVFEKQNLTNGKTHFERKEFSDADSERIKAFLEEQKMELKNSQILFEEQAMAFKELKDEFNQFNISI